MINFELFFSTDVLTILVSMFISSSFSFNNTLTSLVESSVSFSNLNQYLVSLASFAAMLIFEIKSLFD
ncbi:MAG: hypothetical protein K0S12_2135 [Bacteroidetes bacterium]|nr:hypothetical protein [Bacteroidota bacterium]